MPPVCRGGGEPWGPSLGLGRGGQHGRGWGGSGGWLGPRAGEVWVAGDGEDTGAEGILVGRPRNGGCSGASLRLPFCWGVCFLP